jgi:2'-5' RNA ligase
MEDNFIKICVAFIPPEEVIESAVKRSKEISQKADAFYILDEKNFYSHVTIYAAEFLVKNLKDILLDVENLSKKLLTTKFIFTKMAFDKGWIGVETELSGEIKTIHNEIIKACNPLRENHLREKYQIMMEKLLEAEKNNLQFYGHPHVMDLYRPHLTLIRIKNEDAAEKIAGEVEWLIKEFLLDKIGIFKMGEHGTCVELIKKFNLK